MTTPEDKTTVDHDASAHSVPMRAQASLLIYLHGGVKVVPLEPDRPLVIGRAFPADVVVDDLSLSRQHARIGWQQGQLWIEDLGSTNGTHVRGERITTRVSVAPGETVQLGAATASVNVTVSADALLRGVIAHERFLARLEDEVLRARTFGRPLALLMVRAVAVGSGHAARWLPRIRGTLRPIDTISLYAPGAVLAMLPETDREQAHRVASSLVTPALGEPPLVCGIATWPEARSAQELLDRARDAARAATPSSAVRHASGQEPDAASRSVVVASPAMREVYALVRKIAGSSIPVLIQGETGAGKEVVARAIHAESPRRSRPLRSINCGAIPATLIESVLFGHEKGAFTGAERAAPGLFEQADGGTVMLDEVGELSAAAQAALLRVLETKRVTRVGSVQEIECDVRVVAATHRDLEQMVASGTFRRDLLYRLNAMTLRVPPLRERPEEIDVLSELFLEEASKASGLAVRTFDPQARALLRSYAWPGNVRELRNVIERAALVCAGDAIRAEDLGERITHVESAPPPSSPGVSVPARADDADADFKDRVRQYETELILEALRRAGGNQTQAAKILRMPLRTLVHKMKSHGIRKLWAGAEGDDDELGEEDE
ncbi:sigma-54-dependent Fis family transcriptional regulator [Sandaracinus amylolyticus]|uniref:Two component, sigma54 specific, transcriptional regulator, Fis family n=1 Tax=Sandaracinus amylolyticus TaxID=927083 RepID=A0A0F6W1R7_9BACT|nr:sigma-54-dependent Fis family transcriptional regulator [Sandaracinus amylolyticus]AKF05046.1 two component, sigma54 specific, transcriptional regulator, Fis family [Sandaracinus amylolyticus]